MARKIFEHEHAQGSGEGNGAIVKKSVWAGKISILILFFTGIVFSNCTSDEFDVAGISAVSRIDARVENGSAYNSIIYSVKLLVGYNTSVVNTALFSNVGFTANLPSTVNSENLGSIEYFFDNDYDLKFSDKKALITRGVFLAYSFAMEGDEGQPLDWFFYGDPGKGIEGFLVYVDRDVTISGGSFYYDDENPFADDMEVTSLNLSLKMGWNIIYKSETYSRNIRSIKLTTKEPSNMKWYYSNDWREQYK